jgi:hypothetical protein
VIDRHISFSFFEDLHETDFKISLGEMLTSLEHAISGDPDIVFLYTAGIVSTYLEAKISDVSYHQLYVQAIDSARRLFMMDPSAKETIIRLGESTPYELKSLIYTSKYDKYTWTATDPILIRRLADKIDFFPSHIIASAHGCIRPGLMLSCLLGSDVYFVRHSKFKAKDNSPILDDQDLAYIRSISDDGILLMDEDVASGTTLKKLSESLGFLNNTKTASVLAHYLAPFKPDYIGKTWYD